MNTNFFIDREDLINKNLLVDTFQPAVGEKLVKLSDEWFLSNVFIENEPLSLHISCNQKSKSGLQSLLLDNDISYKAYN